ncbi:MAG TPA: hypothetical protein VN372_02835 [Methanospirillum sp.]|nr:hypothetical protein [Methanospirillum sp.]
MYYIPYCRTIHSGVREGTGPRILPAEKTFSISDRSPLLVRKQLLQPVATISCHHFSRVDRKSANVEEIRKIVHIRCNPPGPTEYASPPHARVETTFYYRYA